MDHNPYDLKKHNVDWKEKEKPPAGYLDTDAFLKKSKPDIVINCAGKVGGILANYTYPKEFLLGYHPQARALRY